MVIDKIVIRQLKAQQHGHTYLFSFYLQHCRLHLARSSWQGHSAGYRYSRYSLYFCNTTRLQYIVSGFVDRNNEFYLAKDVDGVVDSGGWKVSSCGRQRGNIRPGWGWQNMDLSRGGYAAWWNISSRHHQSLLIKVLISEYVKLDNTVSPLALTKWEHAWYCHPVLSWGK